MAAAAFAQVAALNGTAGFVAASKPATPRVAPLEAATDVAAAVVMDAAEDQAPSLPRSRSQSRSQLLSQSLPRSRSMTPQRTRTESAAGSAAGSTSTVGLEFDAEPAAAPPPSGHAAPSAADEERMWREFERSEAGTDRRGSRPRYAALVRPASRLSNVSNGGAVVRWRGRCAAYPYVSSPVLCTCARARALQAAATAAAADAAPRSPSAPRSPTRRAQAVRRALTAADLSRIFRSPLPMAERRLLEEGGCSVGLSHGGRA